MKTFYITTPIYYANSSPHLGHLYTTIVADAIKRGKKQRGFDTYFLTGTDEHGVNIQRAAEKNNRTPQAQVDFVAGEIAAMFADFGLNTETGGYDVFMRTTNAFHYEGVQNFWREIAKNTTPKGNAAIYKGFYEGWFCPACASFKSEDEYETHDDGVPTCLIHLINLDKVAEESYFFRLSDYGETLLQIIEETPRRIRPEARRNEVVSFIKSGLQDLSISRQKSSVSWGIPVPDDDSQTMYVWLDALSNYITAIGYGNSERAEINFEKYWQNVTHLVGKDILRFHTVYWFAFLLAAKVKLPETVYAHGLWLDGEGRKMSKTIGNTIEPHILHQHFSNDAVRYFCLREMAFGQDGKFSYENLIERANADLAKGLGNLSSRTLTMIQNYCGGNIPSGDISDKDFLAAKRLGILPDAQETAKNLEISRDEFLRQFDDFEFNRALETAWNVVAKVDKMISDAKPWDLMKTDSNKEIVNAVLYRAVETLRWLCVILHPILPEATQNIYHQIGLNEDLSITNPEKLTWGELSKDVKINEIKPLFPRLDKNKIMSEISEQLAVSGEQSKTGEPKVEQVATVETKTEDVKTEENFITIDDFLKVELRVGEIKVAERIPKADKLLRFEIDLGEAKPRQILAGLAEYYEPETLVGRKVVVVANLKPRMMRGLESQGMICAASLENETPALASFLESVSIGARLK